MFVLRFRCFRSAKSLADFGTSPQVLDKAPVLRRLTLSDNDSKDFLSRQGDRQVKTNGVYAFAGSEDKGTLDWKFEYEVDDRISPPSGKIVVGEKVRSFLPLPTRLERNSSRASSHCLFFCSSSPPSPSPARLSFSSGVEERSKASFFFPSSRRPSSSQPRFGEARSALTPSLYSPEFVAGRHASLSFKASFDSSTPTKEPSSLSRRMDAIAKAVTPSSSSGPSTPSKPPTPLSGRSRQASYGAALTSTPPHTAPLPLQVSKPNFSRKRSISLRAQLRPSSPPSTSSHPPPAIPPEETLHQPPHAFGSKRALLPFIPPTYPPSALPPQHVMLGLGVLMGRSRASPWGGRRRRRGRGETDL